MLIKYLRGRQLGYSSSHCFPNECVREREVKVCSETYKPQSFSVFPLSLLYFSPSVRVLTF